MKATKWTRPKIARGVLLEIKNGWFKICLLDGPEFRMVGWFPPGANPNEQGEVAGSHLAIETLIDGDWVGGRPEGL